MSKLIRQGIWHRSLHLIALSALVLIAVDAFRTNGTRPDIIDPLVWSLLYSAAAVGVLVFVLHGGLKTLQLMTVIVCTIGVMRGVLFFVDDQRLTPMGLNTLIALYAVLTHKYERDYIFRKARRRHADS